MPEANQLQNGEVLARIPQIYRAAFRKFCSRDTECNFHVFLPWGNLYCLVPRDLDALEEFWQLYTEVDQCEAGCMVLEYARRSQFALDIDYGHRRAPESPHQLAEIVAEVFNIPLNFPIHVLKVDANTVADSQDGHGLDCYHVIAEGLFVTSAQMLMKIQAADREWANDNHPRQHCFLEAVDRGIYAGEIHLRAPNCSKRYPNQPIVGRKYQHVGTFRRDDFDDRRVWVDFGSDDWSPTPYRCFLNYPEDMVAEIEEEVIAWQIAGTDTVVRLPPAYAPDSGVFSFDYRNKDLVEYSAINEIVTRHRNQANIGFDEAWDLEVFNDMAKEVVEYLNRFFAKVESTPPIYVKSAPGHYESITRDGWTRIPTLMTHRSYAIKAFHDQFLHLKHRIWKQGDKAPKEVYWTKVWEGHHLAKRYRCALNFSSPIEGQPTDYAFNTWTGLGTWPADAFKWVRDNSEFAVAAVDLFIDFLQRAICGDKDESEAYRRWFFNLVVHFLMNEVTNPHSKFPYVVTLWSVEQGVGKGQLIRLINMLLGVGKVFEIIGKGALGGNFDGYAARYTLVVIDEGDDDAGNFHNNADADAHLKKMSTDWTSVLRTKYKDPELVNLPCSFFKASNFPSNIPFSDRRHACGYVNPIFHNNAEYWRNFNDVLFEKKGWQAIMVWLFTLKANPNFQLGEKPVIGRVRARFAEQSLQKPVPILFTPWLMSDRDDVSLGLEVNWVTEPFVQLYTGKAFAGGFKHVNQLLLAHDGLIVDARELVEALRKVDTKFTLMRLASELDNTFGVDKCQYVEGRLERDCDEAAMDAFVEQLYQSARPRLVAAVERNNYQFDDDKARQIWETGLVYDVRGRKAVFSQHRYYSSTDDLGQRLVLLPGRIALREAFYKVSGGKQTPPAEIPNIDIPNLLDYQTIFRRLEAVNE